MSRSLKKPDFKGKEQPEQKSHFLSGAMRKTVGLSHKAEAKL